MRTIGIYPGRFHPFHKGHASSFKQLAQKFGLDNTYLAISSKQEQPKSPFSAQDRAKMATSLGIPAKNIIAVRNPYAAQEYIDQLNLDPEHTALVFGVSKKDMEGDPKLGIAPDPRFSFANKRDGSPSYLQPFNPKKVDPMSQHGYVMSTDVAEFPIAGKQMRDASAIRKAYAGANDKTKMRILKDLYGAKAENMKQVFDNNLQVTESIRRLIDAIKPMLSEASPEQKAKFVQLLSEAKTILSEGEVIPFKKKQSQYDKYADAFSKQHSDEHRHGVGWIECPYCGEVNCDYDCDGSQADGQLDEYSVRKTKKFIQKAHDTEQGQMYGDMPYSSHPKAVAAIGKKFFGPKFTPEAVKVALLHDVLEDTPYTPEQLAKKGFSPEVIQAVQLLTKDKSMSYSDNIRKIIDSKNILAMMVKYCDNYMNYTGDKSHWAPDRAAASQKKYLASLNMLGDALGIKKHVGDEVTEAIGNVADYSYDMTDVDDRITKAQLMNKASEHMLKSLTPREEYAVRARLGLDGEEPRTLAQVGATLGVAPERARQIIAKATRKLRKKTNYYNRPLDAKDASIERRMKELRAVMDKTRDHRGLSISDQPAKELSNQWDAAYQEWNELHKKLNQSTPLGESMDNLYSKGQAAIIDDLGNGYFLGDDSYDDDEGFTKEGYSVYFQEGPDQFRHVGHVEMSPYNNEPGAIGASIQKLIHKDQPLDEESSGVEHAYSDPATHSIMAYARQHYPEEPDLQAAFVKFVLRSLKHSKEDDERQDNEIELLLKRVNSLQDTVDKLKDKPAQKSEKVDESVDYLDEK